jgi:hypothetical protein
MTVLVATPYAPTSTPSLHAAPSPSPAPALTGPAELVIPDFAIPRPGNDNVLALLEATLFSPTTMPGASTLFRLFNTCSPYLHNAPHEKPWLIAWLLRWERSMPLPSDPGNTRFLSTCR